MKIIISGGGTGGHIYPAIAIANALKNRDPQSEILFVGAKGKMEMEKVPKAGYEIVGLDIVGIQRRMTWKNLLVPYKLLKSLMKARSIIRSFNPDVAIGVGGYASGPLLKMASISRIPYLIQEQNSYAGVTNKLLAKKASKICVAYDHMDQFFPIDKLKFTGNPVRQDIVDLSGKQELGYTHFGLDPQKKTILVFGGSLGARTLSDAIANGFDRDDVNLIWQVGKMFYDRYASTSVARMPNVKLLAFIDRMDLAYAVADMAVTRAGALTISELSIVGMPSIMVPFPYASEDHQTQNAKSLVDRDAGLLVKDSEADQKLIPLMNELIDNDKKRASMSSALDYFMKPNAVDDIVSEILKIAKKV